MCRANGSQKRFLQYLALDILEIVAEKSIQIVNSLLRSTLEFHDTVEWRDNVHRALAYRPLLEQAEDLKELMEVIVSDAANEPESDAISHPIQLSYRRIELLKLARRFIDREDRRFQLYHDTLNIEESQSIMRLTALATIFFTALASSQYP